MKILKVYLVIRSWKVLAFFFAIAGTTCSTSTLRAAPPAKHVRFHVEKRWILGGEGGWGTPLFDSGTHTLYIARTDRVMMVDTKTGRMSGEITGFIGAHTIALDDSGRFGYVTDLTDGEAGFVRVFDRNTCKIIASIPVGLNPDAILFEPVSKMVFVFNSTAHSTSVIDVATNQVVATIPLPGRPGSVTTDGAGGIFVELSEIGRIVHVDAVSRKVETSWSFAPCIGPHGMAVDQEHRQLFLACENRKLISMNTTTGRVISIGKVMDGPGEVRFDRRHHLLFVANGAGELGIFSRKNAFEHTKLQEISTLMGAHTMAIDEDKTKIYLVTAQFGQRTGNVSEELRFRPTPQPGTFTVIVVTR